MSLKDPEARFNPATYMVIDRVTGEEVDVAIFVERASKSGWQKAFAKVLAEYIDCAGDKSSTLLAWLIKNKDQANLILGTQSEIAGRSRVSIAVTKRVMKKLIDKGMMKLVRSGCYMITPKMMRVGDNYKGAMLLRLWGEI